jgi:pyocin large subunit-like protein
MGTVFDMSEDGKAFVATGDRVLCQCPNNVIFGSTTQYVSSATGTFSQAAPIVVEALTTAATLSPSALPVAPVPVFAKSCERGAGNTDAGTTDEPHSNFGRVGYYVPAPLDTMPPEPVQHAQAAKRKPSNTGKHSENDLPWYKRMFGAKSDAPAQSGMPLAVPAATNAGVELATAGWQGLRFVGGGFMTAGRWLVRTSPTGAAIIGMLPGTLNEGEPDMLAGSQLAALAGKSAPTRIRFQWVDAGDGQLKPVAYHTGADSGLDQVRVRSMRKNSHTGNYEFWADGADKPTIIWTPDELEFKAPANTGNRDAPYLPSTITVLPLPGADEVGSTSTSLPIPDEKSFDDYILINLPHSMPPIYFYLSKNPIDPIWTERKKITPVQNAYGHWLKHGAEFPELSNSKEYVDATHDFVNNPPDGTLSKTRANGDQLFYHPESNTLGIKSKDGAPRTMFKPTDKMDYWNDQ